MFDACRSITRASGRGLGPGNREFFGPCERKNFFCQNTNNYSSFNFLTKILSLSYEKYRFGIQDPIPGSGKKTYPGARIPYGSQRHRVPDLEHCKLPGIVSSPPVVLPAVPPGLAPARGASLVSPAVVIGHTLIAPPILVAVLRGPPKIEDKIAK